VTVMRDLSYAEAKELAELRYERCLALHKIQKVPLSALVYCVCGWYGKSINDWASHVEKDCAPRG